MKDIVVTKDKQKIELEEKTNKVSHKLVDTLDAKKEKYSCRKNFESGTCSVFSRYMTCCTGCASVVVVVRGGTETCGKCRRQRRVVLL